MHIMISLLLLLVTSQAITWSHACDPALVPITNEIPSDSSWIDTMNNRVDIIENQLGAPLSIYLRVINRIALVDTCADPNASMDYSTALLSNVQVDIWQVNATGFYSDNISTTWLRGYQITNTTGQVTFYTIFPAWTMGRTTHINVRVRMSDNNGGFVEDDTTQLFFDDAISNSVYASFASLYPTYGTRDTYNTNDTLFSENMLMTVTGDAINGYEASIDLMYPFTVVTTTDAPTAAPTDVTPTDATPTDVATSTDTPTDVTPTDGTTTDTPTNTPTDAISDATTIPPTDMPTTATPTTNITTPTNTTTLVPTDTPMNDVVPNTSTGTNNASQLIISPLTWLMAFIIRIVVTEL